MRILVIAPSYAENAWMVSSRKTAEMLVNNCKYDVTVITSNVGNYPKEEVINGVKVIRFKTWFIPDPFNYAIPFGLFKWLRKHRDEFDIFIVNKYMFYTSLSAIYLKMLKKKVIVQTDTFPGINWFHPKSKILNAGMWIYSRTIGKWVLKSADKVVLLHDLNIPYAEKMHLDWSVIPNAVDIRLYENAEPAKDILEIKKNGNYNVVWIGRLDKIKGYEIYLKIAEMFNTEIRENNLNFIMVCGNKYPEKLSELKKQYPYVHFFSHRTDIPNVLKACDINMLTSYDEGLPNTIIEAMACALPIISTNVGGVPTLVDKDVNGYLFNPSEWFALAFALLHLSCNKRKMSDMGMKSYDIAKEKYDYKIVADKWQKLIEEVIA
jgi:glycosyltransferase involved in cell wall biosynthesis